MVRLSNTLPDQLHQLHENSLPGKSFLYDFGEGARYRLTFVDDTNLDVTVVEDSFFAPGTVNHCTVEITQLRDSLVMITWEEKESSNTVVHVDDFSSHVSYTNITTMSSGQFWRLKGTITEE